MIKFPTNAFHFMLTHTRPPMIAGEGVHFVVIVVFCSILTTLEPDSMTFASEALEVEINSL